LRFENGVFRLLFRKRKTPHFFVLTFDSGNSTAHISLSARPASIAISAPTRFIETSRDPISSSAQIHMNQSIIRRRLSLFIVTTLFAIAACSPVLAQGTKADYERSASLHQLWGNRVFRDEVTPNWFAGGKKFWYEVKTGPDEHEFVLINAEKGERKLAFDHERLAKLLSEQSGQQWNARSLHFSQLRFADDANSVTFHANDQNWRVTGVDAEATLAKISDDDLTEASSANSEKTPGRNRSRRGRRNRASNQFLAPEAESPDHKFRASIVDFNVQIVAVENQETTSLSSEGTAEHRFVGEFFWSPDSRYLVVPRVKKGDQRRVHLIESSPTDQLQPKLDQYDYLKPGDQIDLKKPMLFDVVEKRMIPIDDSLFPTPWSIHPIHWHHDSSRFTFLYNQRGHQIMRMVSINAATGSVSLSVDENSPTFIDYNHKQFDYFLDKTDEIIWMSERDGWNHLYLFDSRTGQVKNQITKGNWVVRNVEQVEESNRQITFSASGMNANEDPYHVHYYRIGFDGNDLVKLTEGDGNHSIDFSPNGEWIVDRYSRVDLPPVAELRRVADGKLVCGLETADVSALANVGWRMPERFVAKGRDGTTDIHGIIHRPSNFEPSHQYPVIEYIYAGPHDSHVPKSFSAIHELVQSVAELGFIVVQIDGMGTSNRSKAFHDVCWKNLGDSGFPDRILWMKSAAAKYSEFDLERVGIFGGSAGGQSALRALLAHGDFYDAAAADCGCHDNRMDKIWWNELWMGWPIGPHYEEQSNVTQAHRLTGKLLLTVGELDKNVDPASTMQVVNALIKADKDFELVVFPGGGHGICESPYGRRRRADFFVRHLLGVEPRAR
jgi:dipeptidyl-peptidase 4